MFPSVSRGLAIFLGAFTLLNVIGDLGFRGSDANIWWIDFAPLPNWLRQVMLVLLAAVLLAGVRRIEAKALIAVALLFAAANAIRYSVLISRGAIHSSVPIPLSLLIVAALGVILLPQHGAPTLRATVATVIIAGILFPLAQISLFGATDYRRPADVIVVFGARAYADGTPSGALADRVRTACDLYDAGLAPRLLFSGGPGEGAIDEPETMARYAKSLGVPESAILLDPQGINTESTVRNTVGLPGKPRILAVSHFYHLPRIKMTFQRYGVNVFTVPSENTVHRSMPINLVREDIAFWAYYLRRFSPSPPANV
jgi:vancomycin permeability regulator SanA